MSQSCNYLLVTVLVVYSCLLTITVGFTTCDAVNNCNNDNVTDTSYIQCTDQCSCQNSRLTSTERYVVCRSIESCTSSIIQVTSRALIGGYAACQSCLISPYEAAGNDVYIACRGFFSCRNANAYNFNNAHCHWK